MGSELPGAVLGGVLGRDGGEAAMDAAGAAAGPYDPRQDASGVARARRGAIEVRVSYAGECSVEEAVSRYLAARDNVRDVIGDELD